MVQPPTERFVTKGDYAYAQVRLMILSGELGPGSAVNQEALAARIGVSTTPLREALRRLKSEGWVRLDAHSDARVAELTAEEARDLSEVRVALDPRAAGLAAERRTAEDIEAMTLAAERLRPLIGGADESVLIAHRQFHATIYRASHNAMLVDLLESLWDKVDRYRRFGLGLVDASESRLRDYHDHFALMQAVVDGDPGRAESIMREHVSASVTARVADELSR